MKLLAVAVLAIGILAMPAAAQAANRFAEVGGDGPEPCLSGDPCGIVNAINNAVAPDDVTLLGGVPPATPYTIATALFLAPDVTVHGSPGFRPLIQNGVVGNSSVSVSAGAALRDVSIDHADVNGGAVSVDGGTAERVYARSAGHNGCSIGPGGLIRDSVCWTTGTLAADGAGLTAFSGPGTTTATIRNVTAVATSSTVPGISLNVVNVGATATLNTTNVIAESAGGVDVSSNVFPCCAGATGNIVLDHSNYDSEFEDDLGGTVTITDPGTGTNKVVDPVFENAASGDFRQTQLSTGTIDQGVAGTVNGVGLGSFDLDGEARTYGALPDIGADEAAIPQAPFVNSINPANVADTLTPRIQGTAQDATDVWIFTDDACTVPPAGTGTKSEFEGVGVPVSSPVDPGSQTVFYAQAFNGAFSSECSSVHVGPGNNQVYSVIPTPPQLQTTNPPTGSNNNAPSILGTGRSDTNTVQIFSDAACTNQVGTGTLGQFTAPGIQVSVADNSTTTFYGKATGFYGSSTCSTPGLSYTEVTPPPSTGPTGQRAAALKKCAKIKSKKKKKKCKKKARKLPV